MDARLREKRKLCLAQNIFKAALIIEKVKFQSCYVQAVIVLALRFKANWYALRFWVITYGSSIFGSGVTVFFSRVN